MKGLNLFLAACFTVPMMDGAVANTLKTGRENAIQRGTSTAVNRANSVTKRTNTSQSRTANPKNIIQRTTSTINTLTDKNRAALSTTRDITSRTAKKQNILTRAPAKTETARTATPIQRTLSRAAINETTKTRESVMQRDFGKCKSVFFDCMDEFCANKDTQLKRCACSTRANEFRNTQKSLDNVEDKLLDFSQRLLQVNMDPADAAVINIESEGERAYNETRDKTASKKMLDEIAKKLNTTFDSAENTNGGMSALTWSLDMDSAFDSVDSLTGVSTSAKSGTALRNVALPICRDMAAEVCTTDDISLVENSYNMAIEQDCNTVKKAYDTQTQNARTKILESGALLDMTRLNNYQDKNSDDILTCKSKMLDMLTDTNVCGTDLTKCLDISGQYINPTTGEAFLSPDLVNIANLLVRPTNGDTWSKTPQNSTFVSFLNSKKKYIEPATKNCESIADDVWNGFIDDALAKIKLAQNAKLEDVRQSCTKLLTECLDNAKTTLSDFDSRALSTFGVMTDKTANALCENVKTSCAAIMEYTPDNTTIVINSDNPTDPNYRTNWIDGTTDIAATETYNTIINTCREVGRDCIINSCKSITGNFGLCESINGSVNRHSILTRNACWDDVLTCINSASDESIITIKNLVNIGYTDFYTQMYGEQSDYNICESQCTSITENSPITAQANCYRCRIAEQIWGNCQHQPDNKNTNAILIPTNPNKTTLLSWFAKNTHTDNRETYPNSCATSICPVGSIDILNDTSTICIKPQYVVQCPTKNIVCERTITTPSGKTNCCPTNMFDSKQNCCMDTKVSQYKDHLSENTVSGAYCTTSSTTNMTQVAQYTTSGITTHIFCTGNVTGTVGNDAQINCDGEYIIAECNGTTCTYNTPTPTGNGINYTDNYSVNYFINANGATITGNTSTAITNETDMNNYCPTNEGTQPNKCTRGPNGWTGNGCTVTNTNGHWMVKF